MGYGTRQEGTKLSPLTEEIYVETDKYAVK